MSKKTVLAIAAGLVAVLGFGVLGMFLGQKFMAAQGLPSPTPTAPSPSPTGPPPGFATFRYPPAGFALGYPDSWELLQHPDPRIVFAASPSQQKAGPPPASGAPQNSFLIRVVHLDSPVGRQQLPAVKKLIDRRVASGTNVNLPVKPQQITLGGVPGYYYFYTFKDPATGRTGVHSRYFLFNGKQMIVLVFQAQPKEQFQRLAPTFDRITGTFRVLK